jgi:hypothetical protein
MLVCKNLNPVNLQPDLARHSVCDSHGVSP